MIPNHPSGLAIVARVAALYGVDVDLLMSRRKGKALAEARHLSWWKIREDLGWSYTEIGKCLGIDHTSVMYGVKRTGGQIRDGTGCKLFTESVQALENQKPAGGQNGEKAGGPPSFPTPLSPEPIKSLGNSGSESGSLLSSDPKGSDSKRARVRRLPADKPEVMTPDWSPPAESIDAQAVRWNATQDQIRRTLPEFRVFWIGQQKRKNKSGWLRAWTSRVAALAKRGELWVDDLRSAPRPYNGKPPGLVEHERQQAEDRARRPELARFKPEPEPRPEDLPTKEQVAATLDMFKPKAVPPAQPTAKRMTAAELDAAIGVKR